MDEIFSPATMQTIMNMSPFILMAVLFYFMLYKPHKKQEKQRQDMINSVKRGDKVVTIGGIHGVVVNAGETIVTVKVAEKVELEFSRSAVASVLPK